MKRSRSGCTAKLLTVGLSIAFALLVGEVGLRVSGYSFPFFYTTDEVRGYALRPGMSGWYRKEGAAYVQINSRGLRDREHTLAKPPATVRVAVIGDSYAEALQVPVEATFWAVAERQLRTCPALAGRNIEFINFGVSGYGTAQELLTLAHEVWAYQPDIVLLAVTTNNDITDNARALKRTAEIPYYTLQGGQLTLDNSFRTTPAFRLRNSPLNRAGRWLRDHLRIVQAGLQAHRAFKARYDAWRNRRMQSAPPAAAPPGRAQANDTQPAPLAQPDVPAAELGTDNLIYRAPADQVWQDAWSVTEALIERMRVEVEQHGAQLHVVTLSNGIQVYPDAGARRAFMQRLGVSDLFYPDLRLQAFCARAGIHSQTLAPQLQTYADEHKVFLHGFAHDLGNGHWNQTGHAVAGELIAQDLCAALTR